MSMGMGAVKSLRHVGCGTASGLRTQQVEIKYKKPTAHCGRNAPRLSVGRPTSRGDERGRGFKSLAPWAPATALVLTRRFFLAEQNL